MQRAALLVLLFAAAAGCGPRAAARASEPASHGVSAYLAALRSDDPRRAYSLLSDEVRKEMPYETFAALWKQQAAERAFQARALEEDLKGGADLGERAKVTLPDGKSLSLHRQSGTWRLDVPLLSRTHAATPHAAVEVFAEALVGRDYDSVMRILTARRREGIGKQVDSFVASLERQLGDPRHRIALVGKDRAELQWTDAGMVYKVVLRLEGDEWRVDDVHAWPAPADGEEPESEPAKKLDQGKKLSPNP
jgi:hypothetical protein